MSEDPASDLQHLPSIAIFHGIHPLVVTIKMHSPDACDMPPFDQLAESRRAWIRDVLRPWCQAAPLRDLRRAEMEWPDIAGRVDPQATLWTWAWSRFPALVAEGISGVDETAEVTVTLRDGSAISGYPDARQSQSGQLVLLARGENGETTEQDPISIDDIARVERV